MKILWFTWKDRKNPLAGGAETVNEELAKRLVADGHEVIFLVAGFPDSEKEEWINGYKVIRLGNRWTVYWYAYRYYKKNLIGWANLVIDEVNTIPFFCQFYVKEKNILLCYQLCREIWFYQMFFPLSLCGYLLEPLSLWLLRNRVVLTESESTKKDLLRFGFSAEKIHLFPIGLEIEPMRDFSLKEKFDDPTVLVLGAIRSMKRTLDVIRAFEITKKTYPALQLYVAGDAQTAYGKKVLASLAQSTYHASIHPLGRISFTEKRELLRKCHLICVTSVKEGWGLIVTEANSQGTPAVVYNVDGLRDSVVHGITGLLTKRNTPLGLSKQIISLLADPISYQSMSKQSWLFSQKFNPIDSYTRFIFLLNTCCTESFL